MVESCDRISGRLTGPDASKLKTNALIGGRFAVNGTTEADCSASLLDAASSTGNVAASFDLDVGDFVLDRVEAATCMDLRARK